MVRGLRFLFARVAIAGAILAPASCASILGIDPGLPRDDGSDASDASDDSTTGGGDVSVDDVSAEAQADVAQADSADGGSTSEAGDAPNDQIESADASDGADAVLGDAAGQDARGDACVLDSNWCLSHCGLGRDNCGIPRQCTNNCPTGWLCESSSNQCRCQADPRWCIGRCGATTDNCGARVDCGNCATGTACNAGTCGCAPAANPCGSRLCGETLDSCNHPVTCGVNGMCANGGICNANAGTCCAPNANPCAGRCGVSVDNGCGQLIACPATCGASEVCDPQGYCCTARACGGACGAISNGCGATMTCGCPMGAICDTQGICCVPTGGCSPTCVDNCGQQVPCCPPDSGMPSCEGPNAPCPGGYPCCPGLSCLTVFYPEGGPPPTGHCQ